LTEEQRNISQFRQFVGIKSEIKKWLQPHCEKTCRFCVSLPSHLD
jgi:hypothetical protein